MQTTTTNRRVVLAQRPKGGAKPADFRLEEASVPSPGPSEALLRTVWLSLDPYMRGRMNEGPSYAAAVEVGAVMGADTVSRVVESRSDALKPGDLVLARTGWLDYAVAKTSGLRKLPADMAHPSYALGVLGMPGFTAYVGLLDIGQPKAGETVVVSAATGAVGSVVGQIARIKGCRAVGIAGGAEKCRFAVETLGFDACIDHSAAGFPQQLAAACPKGIDVYFENVGGKVLDAVLPLLNMHARIPLCGIIAHYNAAPAEGHDRAPALMAKLLAWRVKMQGFIILDHAHRQSDFLADMTAWVSEGRVKYREDVVEGLEKASEAFLGLLEGRNFGKLLVRVGED